MPNEIKHGSTASLMCMCVSRGLVRVAGERRLR